MEEKAEYETAGEGVYECHAVRNQGVGLDKLAVSLFEFERCFSRVLSLGNGRGEGVDSVKALEELGKASHESAGRLKGWVGEYGEHPYLRAMLQQVFDLSDLSSVTNWFYKVHKIL